jgi:SprT-like family
MIAGGLKAIGTLAVRLNADLFGRRLPRLNELRWHGDSDGAWIAQAWIDPRRRVLSLHVTAEELDRRGLTKVLVHELCHLCCANETADHGPRWQRSMVRVGLDPVRGTVLFGNPLHQWLERHQW